MVVTSLILDDVRNYDRLELRPHPELTVLVGPNAVGKTNVIEALQLVTAGASFRRPAWQDLVRWDRPAGRVSMRAEEGERILEVTLDVTREGTHTFSVNGRAKRRTVDVAGRLPSVTFTPDDLDLVKGPAERRRGAIDDLGGQLSPAYASLRRDFGRVVRQRNALLKEETSGAQMAAWDEQIAALGAKLLTHRLRLLGRVMDCARDSYQHMSSGESLSWRYADRCGLPAEAGAASLELEVAEAAIRVELERRAPEERRRATTLVGPHRDDVVFLVDGREARAFASQGQQRTVALAWKLAEVSVIEDLLKRRPVLLLDDVMSELDADRRASLRTAVAGRTQTFITTTNLGYFDAAALADATVVEL